MILVHCPHCEQLIEIVELNCRIFRCGIYRTNYQPIPPHHPKIQCDSLVAQNLIFGCGKPFRVVVDNEQNNKAVECDYI